MLSQKTWTVWKTLWIGVNHDLVKKIKETKPYETDGRHIEPHSQKRYSLEPSGMDMVQSANFTVEASARELCPAEVGLQLRVQYMDQAYGETLVIAMQPIMDSDELASVFTVHHWDWGLCLGGCCCGVSNNEDEWHADSEWVFVGGELLFQIFDHRE